MKKRINDKRIQLYQGDCLELMKVVSSKSIDMILCDLPYGTTACKWDTVISFGPLWNCYKRIIKDHGAIVLFGSEPFSSHLRMSNLGMYKYDWIYVKSQATNFLNAKKQPLRNHELISVFYQKQCVYNPIKTEGKPYKCISGSTEEKSVTKDTNITEGGHLTINFGDRYPLTVTEKFNVETGEHPTQKPVPLLEYLIKTYSNQDDLILDNCMGSGSTGVACKNLDRKFIGMELDEKYFEIAKKRIHENRK